MTTTRQDRLQYIQSVHNRTFAIARAINAIQCLSEYIEGEMPGEARLLTLVAQDLEETCEKMDQYFGHLICRLHKKLA